MFRTSDAGEDVTVKQPAEAPGDCGEKEQTLDGPFVKTLAARMAGGVQEPRLVEAGEERKRDDGGRGVVVKVEDDEDQKLPCAGELPEQPARPIFTAENGNAADATPRIARMVAEVAEEHIEKEVTPRP